ncbi:MAG: glutamate synthase large subunit [Candidatus Omnitrophica bacterium]|nr:glutamate synthase large subunit [Candidatus Omnitrophota bacterium]MDE2232074.1 glutamate synthase large subunit [Candidatus Omnitrophota bacterium]
MFNPVWRQVQLSFPPKQGLYDPRFEHDSCGVGFIAHIKGLKSHDMVRHGIEILENLTHRGACGCDPETGDGAGILMQMPDAFFRKELAGLHLELPPAGDYGAGLVFLPTSPEDRNTIEEWTEHIIHEEGQKLIGWREVPHEPNKVGRVARSVMPAFKQLFIARGAGTAQEDFDRKLYVVRKRLWNKVYNSTLPQRNYYYFCSLNSHTLVYKGQLMSEQLDRFFPDLSDPAMVSAIALVHSRYSTNTFPTWALAHPYRYIAHNGEINTLRGNINWIQTREKQFVSKAFGDDIKKVLPIVVPHGSDTATFDNVLEMLVLCGRSLPHAMMMMIPEAWSNHQEMDRAKRAFYEYHSCLMEPWDGPAAIAFSDGRYVGALLDRNGLRPSRYLVTSDDIVIMASEAGVLPVADEKIVSKGRLQPGKMFLVDVREGRIIDDGEVKETYAKGRPYEKWLRENIVDIRNLPAPQKTHGLDKETLLERQRAFGYTLEDLKIILQPMARGEEAIGSMGTDTPLAVLSQRPKLLFEYFKQLFAQVTNPPIDAIREEIIMAEDMMLGPESNLLEEGPQHCHRLWIQHPVVTNEELEKIRHIRHSTLKALTLPTVFDKKDGCAGMEKAFKALCAHADRAIKEGTSILVLSDRDISSKRVPIPSLLACAGLHHHLIRQGTRTRVSLVVETGEARELHHFAVLIGYGANAVNPYLALETIEAMTRDDKFELSISFTEAQKNFLKACHKGLYKIISKMGISTIQSYCGAQIFEAVGLGGDLVDKYFTATPSRIGGINADIVAQEALMRHDDGYPKWPSADGMLEEGGEYAWRKEAEFHQLNPTTIALLQHAARSGNFQVFKQYSKAVNEHSRQAANIRGLLKFKTGKPVPIEEVEPASEIVKRFATGAMSYGSISREAHETLAIAMNRLGGFSNTGEGGEDAVRFKKDPNGDWRRSRIKQVAQGRFGVTIEYLVNADQLQIKMAQGAKPGEGGQLPGHKVSREIAYTRHTTPGVQLISPPPHHDIYSIEDLAQLIHDLKNANPRAMVSVKLVSEIGVGTVAAGVSKGKSDHVLISGYEGGTGASPQTSIKHAGLPMELGIAETQQVLVMNDLRGRIRVQVDGQLKTGRDVVIAALLGADEFGFSTTALITVGCILLRKCHLNTCSVGVATQDPELRKKFDGKPEYVVNFFTFIAEEVRQIMAELGFRKFEDMVGRVDCLDTKDTIDHWKARGVDLTNVLHRPDVPKGVAVRHCATQDHGLEKALDNTLIAQARGAIDNQTPVTIEVPIRNINRTVGTMLSSEVARKYGFAGLPDDTIQIKFKGSAGQSFGAFLAHGISLTLEGEANDYAGKGLSGGRMVIYPPRKAIYVPEENIIVGNVVLYGAIKGEAFFRGLAGERFAVRNSGALAVVEGVGDHGCEYMTGGKVVVIGPTGRNFAAGMSGGIAYVWDRDGVFGKNCNPGMVDLFPVHEEKDISIVRDLIEKHLKFTRSTVAQGILDNWQKCLAQFIKVYPRDYRRVLEEAEAIKTEDSTPRAQAGAGK